MRTRGASGIIKANPRYALHATTSPRVPGGFSEAVKDAQWKEAMDCEISALRETNTWKLVQPKEGMNILSCKWVFRQKMNETGGVDRFKARLVANGMM